MRYFEKRSDIIDEISNRLKFMEDTARHKYFVYQAGRELGVPRFQLLKHDLSKFFPPEFGAYSNYWFGKRNKKTLAKFQEAKKHHYTVNVHHHHPRPLNIELEHIADMWGATRARNPKTPEFKSWILDILSKPRRDNLYQTGWRQVSISPEAKNEILRKTK